MSESQLQLWTRRSDSYPIGCPLTVSGFYTDCILISISVTITHMNCDNCRAEEVAYTLTTYVNTSDGEQVDLHFCSTDCLHVWT